MIIVEQDLINLNEQTQVYRITETGAILGNGDMTKAVYDPTSVGGDAFDMENMVEGATSKIFTDAERTKLTGVETGAEVNNISDIDATDLTDGGETNLHSHAVVGGVPYETVHTFIPADNISSIASVNCTVAKDLTNKIVGDYGVKMTTAAAVTAQILMDPIGNDADPLVFDVAPATIGVAVFIDDVTKVSQVQLNIYSTVALTPVWIRTDANYQEPLVTGWNYMRFPATEGDTTGWGSVYRVRVLVITSAATTVTVGRMWAEIKPKAQLIFIEDGGYTSFLTDAYPDLKARSIPVTWAIDPLQLGAANRITEADVKTISEDGNRNSISFHGFDGAVTSTMTADEIVADTVDSIKWLSARGYAGRMWRGAWVQNSAPNADAASSLILGGATPNETATMGIWPPKDRYDMPRVSVHGSDTATIDAYFDSLKLTHGLMVIYTHGIADVPPPTDMSTAQWVYFLSKVDTGISEGWLEGSTFESLFAKSGGVFNTGFGVTRAEFLEVDGSKTTMELM